MTTPPTPTPDPFEDRLRATLRAAAPDDARTEVGLADLEERIAAGATASAPARLDARRNRTLRVVAIAAAVVVIVGLAAVVVGRSDDGQDLHTQQSVPDVTGWYIPKGLSKDWKLRTVASDFQDVEGSGGRCPCHRRTWVSDAKGGVVRLNQTTIDAGSGLDDLLGSIPADERFDGIDLGHGITASGGTGAFAGGPSPRTETFIAWSVGDVLSVVHGTYVSKEGLIEAARGIAGAQDLDDPPSATYRLVDRVDLDASLKSFKAVHVVMANEETGAVVAYVLVPPGFDPVDTSVVPTVVDLPGAVGPLLRVESTIVPGGKPSVAYLGRWPGASVYTDPDAGMGADTGPATDADVREVLGSLQPATAQEWAAFLDSTKAPIKQGGLDVPTLMDLTQSADGTTHQSADTVPRGSSNATESTGERETAEVTNPRNQTTVAASGLQATDLTFAPVLGIGQCGGDVGTFPAASHAAVLPSTDGKVCYRIGDVAADGSDLSADPVGQVGPSGVALNVQARPEAVKRFNALFNACYDAKATCPSLGDAGRGAVAIVFDGQVISAPEVNGRDLADDGFMISSATLTESFANDLAAAINAG